MESTSWLDTWFDLWFEKMYSMLRRFNYSYTLTLALLWLLSGQMFNYIRGTPMSVGSGMDAGSYIFRGSRYQYGAESFIVMGLYGLIIYGVIELIKAREKQLGIVTESASESASDNDPIDPTKNPAENTHASLQTAIMNGLTCIYCGFLTLQMITNMKT